MKTKLSALFLIVLLGLGGCGADKPPDVPAETAPASSEAVQPAAVMPAALSKTVGGVTVSVDPMVEMLSVIQYLSGYDEKFAVRPEYEDSDFRRNRMDTDMEAFRDAMEQFYLDTDFGAFYEAHRDFYSRMIDTYAANFPQWSMTGAMEAYYGKQMAGYHIILVALFHPGGFGPSLEFEDGLHIYSIQGPNLAENDTPLFGGSDAIANLVLHEFGHSFIPVNEPDNPVMASEVRRSEYLLEAVRNDMAFNAYSDWTIAYEELVLRAAVIDLMMENTGADLETLLQDERDTGFLYIDEAYKALRQYSPNREKYPVFDDFVPVITDALLAAYPDAVP